MAPTVLVEYTGVTGQRKSKKYSQKVLATMMEKTPRSSKGYSSGFVPDYSQAVETIGESEAFGSSGGIDTERTASEDSCAPKRKCISLNYDRCDVFGVPLQVLSVSKMSHSERKDLELRLRADLEQVRILQKKIALRCTNGLAMSCSTDIHSCSDGQKRPPLENLHKSLEMSSGKGKKRVPPSSNGPSMKQGLPGRFESVKQAAPLSTSNTMLMKQCETLLKRLMSHQFGWVFNTPVDVVKLNIPDYPIVIKHPMDLGTVKSKIASGVYSSPLGFLADVRLTFSNAMTYNPPGNDVHHMADTLSKFFEVRWKPIEKKLSVTKTQSLPAKSGFPREMEAAKPVHPSKKRKITLIDPKVKLEPVKRIMTDEEKCKLGRELEALLGEMPEHIVDFLRQHSLSASQTAEDEIEIDVDIDALSGDTLLTLRKLLDDYLREKQTSQEKAEPCDMELLNESGLSNSFIQPCKGNAPIDEDVDIGGNNPPVSSYPPVEIEKDTVHRNSKCSSSSSPSSELGSSSSDSDSGSESNGAKASTPANRRKETLGFGVADLNQTIDDLGDPQDGNQSLSGLDQFEQNPQPMPVSVEADSRQEGESAPSERQVSPEKRYRAALLRNRFADIILKAREKTLDQGEKGDPEKLRLEREELERKRREEKARLQAEAKAAEDAQRRAEAEAAAEAKRRRELEREAARQALQKMEKTVEINETSKFLKDLEMLRSAPAEHLPSSVDEASPDHSQDVMGGFNVRISSNPLEQLGLYMKMDDEEEEEGEPQSLADPVNDVEEGEID
ncbi:hypothetical protein HHK36_029477 [Tetracentron sinense]|uniref:Uncharacterized protein n=1 Tax=Tetracentron sinense TaxID=13715 RepID=A0A834YD24_TETSI|nr:hypothetical protein HHK36_029477 [Tetracentron sinense]